MIRIDIKYVRFFGKNHILSFGGYDMKISIVMATIFALSLAAPATTSAAVVQDQGQIFGTSGLVYLENDTYSQSITAGIAGRLAGIEFQFDNSVGAPIGTVNLDFSLFTGGNPITGSSLFSESLSVSGADLSGQGLYTWDTLSAGLDFSVGEVFTFVFSAQTTGIILAGNDTPGYNGGDLFKNHASIPVQDVNDLGFRTYVDVAVVPLPASLPLMIAGFAGFGFWRRKRG